MTAEDRWAAYLVQADGFVVASEDQDARARELLALIDDPDEIDRQWGDLHPESIVVVRRTALPKPQYPASSILRMPGGYQCGDSIEITRDLHDVIEPDHGLLMWIAAKGAAEALNRVP